MLTKLYGLTFQNADILIVTKIRTLTLHFNTYIQHCLAENWFKPAITYAEEQCIAHVTITILDIINHPVFNLKHDVSETGFCLRLQMKPTQSGDRD
jgi:hypothetical protein